MQVRSVDLTSALERRPSILRTELTGRDLANAHSATQRVTGWVPLIAQTISRYAVASLKAFEHPAATPVSFLWIGLTEVDLPSAQNAIRKPVIARRGSALKGEMPETVCAN